MIRTYSIAEARDNFAALVHDVEQSGAIQITRRNEVVAVLLSTSEYQRLAAQPRGFLQAVAEFRSAYHVANLAIQPEIFEVRPETPGREVDL